MRMLKMEGNGKVSVVTEEDPEPGQGEVLVRTAVSALCGSELHTYRGPGNPRGNNGHEAVGTIVRTGAGVTGLKPGDRVGASAISGCGKCAYCAKGQYTWCKGRRFYGNMHADCFVAAASACYKLPNDIGWEPGVLITGDGMGVPYHTSTKIASEEFRTIAVFGVGPIGLGNVLVQSFIGRRVIAVDVSATRLETARKLGAEFTVNAKEEDPVAAIKRITENEGADACIEAAGRPETALQGFASVRTAGTVVFNGEQGAVSLSPSEHFIRRDITAVGAWYYHFSEIDKILGLYRKGLKVETLISHRFDFDDAAKAYETFSSGQSAKVLLEYELKKPR